MAKLISRRYALPTARAMLSVLCAVTLAGAAWAQSQHHHGQQPQQHPSAGDATPRGADRPEATHAPAHKPETGAGNEGRDGTGHDDHGGHGMVVEESKHFATIGYDDTRGPRPVQSKRGSAMSGNPAVGKRLARSDIKGRCLNCHVLDKEGVLAGDVGPNLSRYATWGRDAAYTFQQVWDARAHNPRTIMPPFGPNDLLSKAEVTHIVAYLHTLKHAITEPQRPSVRKPRERVHVAGVDFSAADDHLDAGSAAFGQAGKNGRSCASCHSPQAKESVDLGGAASRYPRFDESLGRVVGLEEQVNNCRERRMASDPLPLGSRTMNLLAGYVKYVGRENAIKIDTGAAGADAFERGRALFQRKAGQLNFSCADCHDAAAGKWARGQRLQRLDQTAGEWPKHYIALHDLGLINLRQRILHCQIVNRTYPLPLHSQEYLDLEYYLTRLASGSSILAPTMTRLRGE
jgi:sulfur-oxidizing protein SoxA